MQVISNTFKSMMIAALSLGVLGLVALAMTISSFPTDSELRGCMITKMYEVDLCPKSRNYVTLDEVSPFLLKSIVLTEDSAFWTHQGFDFEEIKRSLEKNIKTGKYKRGGSTITQQLAKNLFLTEEKTITRKLKEAVITLRLEKVLKKKEILERYLNVVHWGKNIFGVRAAARYYFQKSPADLTLVESAFLTFLLPSPEKYSLSYKKNQLTQFGEQRLRQIISKLYQYQRISEAEYSAGMADLNVFLKTKEELFPTELDPEEEPKENDPDSF